jgi:hypothetical protein
MPSHSLWRSERQACGMGVHFQNELRHMIFMRFFKANICKMRLDTIPENIMIT